MIDRTESLWRGAAEKHVIDFLLGMAESERAEIERRFLSDPAYLAFIESIETELIEAFLDNELTSAERSAFTAKYAGSDPQLARKVELIKRFRSAANPNRNWPLAGLIGIATFLSAAWAWEVQTASGLRTEIARLKASEEKAVTFASRRAEVRLGEPLSRRTDGEPMPTATIRLSDLLLRVILPSGLGGNVSEVRILDERRRLVAVSPTQSDGAAEFAISALSVGDYFVELRSSNKVIAERSMSLRAGAGR